MRRGITWILMIGLGLLMWAGPAMAQMDWLKDKWNGIKDPNRSALTSTALSDTKIGAGLKEALQVGIRNAIQRTGQPDGYLKNDAIRIPFPERLQALDKGLRMVGLGRQVDEFVLSMNRAAEAAVPQAGDIFMDSLFAMTLDDVQKIYRGGDTAATAYFQDKTYAQLSEMFRPVVRQAMEQYNVTNQYQALAARYQAIPFSKDLPLPDLDDYVVDKSLDGLFLVLGQEEQKIRTNPASRVTDLLKEVFKGP